MEGEQVMGRKQTMRNGTAGALAAALGAWLGAAPPAAWAQGIDVCGCTSSPSSLGAFRSIDPATWPPGTAVNVGTNPNEITIPLPTDGVLIFDSFEVSNHGSLNALVRFAGNAANTPVTLLVRGNVTVGSGDSLDVGGFSGSSGTSTTAGIGGTPGPGGYGGGDGAYFSVNQANRGGTGLGPGGGSGGNPSPFAEPGGGTLVSVPELRPLRGGSGGGGGYSASAGTCSGGGGGGGSGALLIAANGTLSITGTIRANGGPGGSIAGSSCARGGGGGSGGAIRLIANAITGSGRVEAEGGGTAFGGNNGLAGRIRMESFTNTFGTNVAPTAQRLPSPGPVSNPVNPTVAITAVDGTAPPVNPQGYRGQIDLIIAEPGPVQFDVRTTDVPAGTDVEITVKPKLEDPPIVQRQTLSAGSCVSGVCTAAVSVELFPGQYIVEARATFEAP
jgi:hypothetical protein